MTGGRGAAEWVSLGISLVIVLVLVAILTVDQLSSGSRPPTLVAEAQTESVRVAEGAYYLPVEVRNRGDVAARDVRLRVSLTPAQAPAGAPPGDQGAGAEEADLLLDLVPGKGSHGGTVVFRQDPRRGRLTATVVSYVDP